MEIIKGPPIDYFYVVREETLQSGKNVVTEGSYGNWLWVIIEGEVDVKKQTPSGTIKVARLGKGAFIGTPLSLLHGDNRRNATVTAAGNVQLGLLDNERLAADFGCLSADFRNLLASYARRLPRITERAVEFCLRKPQEISPAKWIPFAEKEGNLGKIFGIEKGEAHIFRKTERGFLPILELKSQDFFGSLPFTDAEGWSAPVFVSSDLETKEMDPNGIAREYVQMPAILKRLVQDVASRISKTMKTVYCLPSSPAVST